MWFFLLQQYISLSGALYKNINATRTIRVKKQKQMQPFLYERVYPHILTSLFDIEGRVAEILKIPKCLGMEQIANGKSV